MITQGDNGSVIELALSGADGLPLSLVDCTVSFKIKPKARQPFIKNATIVDANAGIVRVILTSEDLVDAGKYEFQATVTFPTLNKFSTKILSFNVEKKL